LKIKLNLHFYTYLYFLILLILYHYKVKTYYYWIRVGRHINETNFDFSYIRFSFSILILYINIRTLKKLKPKKMAFIIIYVFYYLLTIPSLIAFTSKNIHLLEILIYHQLFFYVLYFFSKQKLNFNWVPKINKSQGLIVLTFIIIVGAIPFIIILGPYINFKNLFLIDIYESRAVLKQNFNSYFAYSYSPFTKIVLPLIIVMSIEQKKWIFTFLGVFYLILFFLFGGHKTVYLGFFAVLFFYKFDYRQIISIISKFSIVLAITAILLAIFNYDMLWILIFRRVHFIPMLLDICYIDFFNNNYLYWSESVLKSFFTYPYDTNHAQVIGSEYFNKPDMAANNGLISDGYMNLGTIGVFINILVVSFYFFVLNSLKIPSKYFGIYLLIILSFISSSVNTVLLTHGGIFLIFTSIFILNEKES